MAIVSSKPLVVTKATRAPLRSSIVFVPTVVPWRTTTSGPEAICRNPFRTAIPGSCGVEKTFNTTNFPFCRYTQSVKVPPVSIATRIILGLIEVCKDALRRRQNLTRKDRQPRPKQPALPSHNHFPGVGFALDFPKRVTFQLSHLR